MLYLYVEAPFAVFRTFTAGWYRPTATFVTPSAAYGLILNVAGIESRLLEGDKEHDGRTPASYMGSGLPSFHLALGLPEDRFPRLQSLYQQLHNYPVGQSGKDRASDCHGNKYNITPVRREFLSDLQAIIALDAPGNLQRDVRRGLSGQSSPARYGIPFLGDNAFLIDRLEEIPDLRDRFTSIQWYQTIDKEDGSAHTRATRLTIAIDRANLANTKSALFAPSTASDAETIPESAWIHVGPRK
ncbi:hypothetical protein Pan216_18910 [Planctomycetes bacterium Pan216]|uniref:CRISPR-associated protein Cas5 n=1 Tax=Kolteria novifilia TaxID=2527975 RepID=A0A518B239_9BACT|nr:hypothetical protein Pan216_18910 [Planctomycetes bacterium Pan216]